MVLLLLCKDSITGSNRALTRFFAVANSRWLFEGVFLTVGGLSRRGDGDLGLTTFDRDGGGGGRAENGEGVSAGNKYCNSGAEGGLAAFFLSTAVLWKMLCAGSCMLVLASASGVEILVGDLAGIYMVGRMEDFS